MYYHAKIKFEASSFLINACNRATELILNCVSQVETVIIRSYSLETQDRRAHFTTQKTNSPTNTDDLKITSVMHFSVFFFFAVKTFMNFKPKLQRFAADTYRQRLQEDVV